MDAAHAFESTSDTFAPDRRVDRMRSHRVNALDERQERHDLRFVPLGLLDHPEEVRAIVRDIAGRPLPPIVERAARAVHCISPRPRYLWQYAYAAIPPTTLSSVDPALSESLTTLKVCASILLTAVDDVADECRDPALFRRILSEVFHDARPRYATDARHDAVVRHMRAAWRFLRSQAAKFPRARELRALFEFDCQTLVHGMSHSLVASRVPEAICEAEQRLWTVSSFYMAVFADLDLMCSPGFRMEELGAVREVIGEAQEMCAIANWIGTWERELRAGDHSSGFFGAALRKGIIEVADLRPDNDTEELLARLRASDVEASLLARWERSWRRLEARRDRMESFDLGRYIAGLERYLQLQLASRGLV